MNIKMEVTAKFTPEQVTNILSDYLKKQGYQVSEIKPIVDSRTVGQLMDEHIEYFFSGVEAKIKVKPIPLEDQEFLTLY